MLKKQTDYINEEHLWNTFLAGDDKAYSCIYKKYVTELFAYGIRFTPDRELVKDCIQDVFVKIYSSRANLHKTDNIKLYLFMALKNTLLNVFQKDKTTYHIDAVEPVFSTEENIEDKLIADELEQERQEKMRRLLELLTPRQKEVIYYRYVENMSINDICLLMDMNYQSVQNLIQRSIKNVRNKFKEKDNTILSIKCISRCL